METPVTLAELNARAAMREVLAHLTRLGRPTTRAAVCQVLNRSRASVGPAIDALVEAGTVVRIGRAQWQRIGVPAVMASYRDPEVGKVARALNRVGRVEAAPAPPPEKRPSSARRRRLKASGTLEAALWATLMSGASYTARELARRATATGLVAEGWRVEEILQAWRLEARIDQIRMPVGATRYRIRAAAAAGKVREHV